MVWWTKCFPLTRMLPLANSQSGTLRLQAGAWVLWSVLALAVACLDLTRLSSFIQPGYNQSETSYVTEEIGTSGYAASLDRYGWWLNKLTGLRQCYQRQTFG